MSGKGFMYVLKMIDVLLERGSCQSGKKFMSVWEEFNAYLKKWYMPI